MSEEKKEAMIGPVGKVLLPLAGAALLSAVGAGATMILKHEGDVRTIDRIIERARVDRYRRNLEHYRDHYLLEKDCITRNKSILRYLEEGSALVPIAEGALDRCVELKEDWYGKIENYVEENKHMGYE